VADSVFVSFYRGLGGIAGAAVAGPHEQVSEARVWRTRMGGTLYSLMPYASAMEREHLALSPRWSAADVPGWSWTEFAVGPATMEWDVDEAIEALVRGLRPVRTLATAGRAGRSGLA